MRKLPLFIVLAYSLNFYSFAIAGSLDTSFHAPHGYVLYHNLFGEDTSGYAVLSSPDGSTLVAGLHDKARNSDAFIIRYLPEGTIDASFGSDGVSVYDSGLRDAVYDLARTPDGNIIAVGFVGSGTVDAGEITADLLVMMLDPDGKPAAFFGEDGIVRIPHTETTNEYGLSVALQPDGKILVGGWLHTENNDDLLIRRFHRDGRLDKSFADSGRFRFDRGKDDYGACIAVLPDAGILIAGRSHNGSNFDAVLIRLRWDGTPDPAFGRAGVHVIDHGADETLEGLSILADNHIVAVGKKETGRLSDLLIVRFTPTGELDPEFGRGGMVLYGSRSHSEKGVALAVGKDNTLYVAGGVSHQGGLRSLIVKFDSNGRQLQKWSLAGMEGFPAGQSEFNLATDIAVQQDGKPVVCGWTGMGTASQRNTFLYTLRLLSEGLQ